MTAATSPPIRTRDELTDGWLTQALGRPGLRIERALHAASMPASTATAGSRSCSRTSWVANPGIRSPMVVVRTDRGDDMFMTQLERSAQQILDLDALSLLPAPGGKAPALVPSPTDEGSHEPGPEATWNESWYFYAVADDGRLGVYVRIGRVPNRDLALYTAAIVVPDQPAILVFDAHAHCPHPTIRPKRSGVMGCTPPSTATSR